MTATRAMRSSSIPWLRDLPVPADWEASKVKYAAPQIQAGETITAESIEESGTFPVYGGNGLRGYTEAKTHSGTRILIGRQGALCGNVHLVDGDFWASEHAIVAAPASEVDPRWLAHMLRTMNLGQYSQTAAQPGIGTGQIRELEIPLPSADEQRAIADYLDRETARIDTLIEEQQRLIEMLYERRQVVIESAAGRGLDYAVRTKLSGLSWVSQVPEHWLVANIRRFASMKTGHTPSRSNPDYWVDCTIPWFTLADVWQLRDAKRTYLDETANRISAVGLANSAAELLPAGTVVLSRTASVGFSGVMPEPMATSQDFWNWVPGERLNSIYLMWVFRAMQREFRSLMIGSTHQTIYQPTAAAIRIPVPPLDEQLRIVDYLDEQTAKIDTLIAETETFIELARERRTALITAAVTGQIDVRGAT